MKLNTSTISMGSRVTKREGFRKRLTVLILFALISFSLPVWAAYLKNVPQTLKQPDGSVLNCLATGDEHYHWLHDANNYTIVQDSLTGYYVYAAKSGDQLVPTRLIAGKDDPSLAGLTPGINLDPERVRQLTQTRYHNPGLKGGSIVNTTGTINNIVIFIRFSDQQEFTDSKSKYNDAFNATGTPSMVQYFKEISGNKLTINTSIFPRSGSSIVSYQDPNPRSYYCKYNAATNTNGYQTETDRYDREMKLLKDATEAVKSDIESSGLDFDSDHNGQIDNICYVVQGATDGWSDLLWPHMFMQYVYTVMIGNARVWNYNFQLSNTFGVNVLCHEMLHSIGFPDLYRYVNTSVNPVSSWDVMASTANPPQHPGAYMKFKYGQWISSLPEITANGTYTLKPLSSDPFAAYKIASPNSTSEYFVVEYRKTEGMFDAQLLGSGLIIYRVNPSLNGNSYGPPDEVYVFRPNGTTTNTGNMEQAFFSSNAGRTTFGGSSNTACFLSNGQPGGIQITNIGSTGETISFTVTIGNTEPPVLALSPTSKDLAYTGGTATFGVSNTGSGTMAWSAAVTTGGSWLHITSGTSGSNSGNINVSADANSGSGSRSAVITVTASDATGSPKTITVSQAAQGAVLAIAPASYAAGSSSASTSFAVSNTGGGTMAWSASVTTGGNWAHITSGGTGSNNGTIGVTLDENTGSSARSAVITVTASDAAGSPKTITISQEAPAAVLAVSPVTFNAGFGSTTTSFSVSNAGGGTFTWSAAVTTGGEWAHITSGTSGSNNGTINVTLDANNGDGTRTAVLTVSANDASGSPKTITISQAAQEAVLAVSPTTFHAGAAAGATTFTVSNNGGGTLNWSASVTSGNNWLHITAGESGSNNGSIEVTLDANTGNDARTAIITVSANDATGSPKTITVSQDGLHPVLQAGPQIQNAGAEASLVYFNVTNAGTGSLNWSATVTSGTSWAQIFSGQSGTNDGTIAVAIKSNDESASRQAILTIADPSVSGSTQTVRIIQAANPPVLQVAQDISELPWNGGSVNFTVTNTGGGSLNWTAVVTAGTGWARITSGSSGTNNGSTRLEVDENMGLPRTATITFADKLHPESQISLTLQQTAKNPELTIDPSEQTIADHGGDLQFGVTVTGFGNINWKAEITSGESWAHIVSGSDGFNNGEIQVEVDPNPSESRTAIITVTSPDGSTEPKIITIHQDITNGTGDAEPMAAPNVYPNPFVSDVTVDLPDFNGTPRQLDVIDLMGRIESTRMLGQSKNTIDLSALAQGTYVFRISNGNNSFIYKRIVKN